MYNPINLFRPWRRQNCCFQKKKKFVNFCNEIPSVSCSGLQPHEKIRPFSFERNGSSQKFILTMETPKFMFLKNFFRQQLWREFMFFLFWYAISQKSSTVWFLTKWIVALIYLGHGDAKSCVFRKTLFNNICNENSCVSCSDFQFREKIAHFSF